MDTTNHENMTQLGPLVLKGIMADSARLTDWLLARLSVFWLKAER
jgi:hypothetical protein